MKQAHSCATASPHSFKNIRFLRELKDSIFKKLKDGTSTGLHAAQ